MENTTADPVNILQDHPPPPHRKKEKEKKKVISASQTLLSLPLQAQLSSTRCDAHTKCQNPIEERDAPEQAVLFAINSFHFNHLVRPLRCYSGELPHTRPGVLNSILGPCRHIELTAQGWHHDTPTITLPADNHRQLITCFSTYRSRLPPLLAAAVPELSTALAASPKAQPGALATRPHGFSSKQGLLPSKQAEKEPKAQILPGSSQPSFPSLQAPSSEHLSPCGTERGAGIRPTEQPACL